MLPRAQRLSSREFEVAFRQGRVLRHSLLQLRVYRRENDSERSSARGVRARGVRAAFVAPKKIGGAVVRNRVRRRVRERYRLLAQRASPPAPANGCDLIFIMAPAAVAAGTAELDAALNQLLERARRIGNDRPGNGDAGRSAGRKGGFR